MSSVVHVWEKICSQAQVVGLQSRFRVVRVGGLCHIYTRQPFRLATGDLGAAVSGSLTVSLVIGALEIMHGRRLLKELDVVTKEAAVDGHGSDDDRE